MSARRYVIVGAGAAGLAAAEAIRERDRSGEITLFSDERHRPYSRPGLAYLLAGALPESQLTIRHPRELQAIGARWVGAKVERVEPELHRVIDAKGQAHGYDRLLIATGSRSAPASFEGFHLDGVLQLDSLDDARDFSRRAKRARTAIVIGGGPTAVEMVEGLRAHRVHTRYFLRGERYWASVLDENESAIVHRRLVHEGVVVHPKTEVRRAIGEQGRLRGVETRDGEHFACDLLCVCIGVRSRVESVEHSALVHEGRVNVDAQLRAAEDVYAAGDVARIYDPSSDRGGEHVLWNAAVDQGRIAGANMTGETLAYRSPFPLNVTQLLGVNVTVIGEVGVDKESDLLELSRGESRVWRRRRGVRSLTRRHGNNRLRIVAGDQRLLGAVVVGDQVPSRALVRAMRQGLDLGPIWARLQVGDEEAMAALLDFIAHAGGSDASSVA